MKIHIPGFQAMAKCNEYMDHGPIDIDLGPNVVAVVRCRECEKAKPGGSGYVWCGKKAMPLNGFCSEGGCGNTHDGEGGND